MKRDEREAESVSDHLVTQALLAAAEPRVRWSVAPHLRYRFLAGTVAGDQPADQVPPPTVSLVTDQAVLDGGNLVTPRLTKLSDQQRRILRLCEVPRAQADLMTALGVSHRTFFRRTHLDPLLQAGLVRMTHPEDPTHPKQAYVVTEAGLGLLSSDESQDEEKHGEA